MLQSTREELEIAALRALAYADGGLVLPGDDKKRLREAVAESRGVPPQEVGDEAWALAQEIKAARRTGGKHLAGADHETRRKWEYVRTGGDGTPMP